MLTDSVEHSNVYFSLDSYGHFIKDNKEIFVDLFYNLIKKQGLKTLLLVFPTGLEPVMST